MAKTHTMKKVTITVSFNISENEYSSPDFQEDLKELREILEEGKTTPPEENRYNISDVEFEITTK